MTDTQKFEGFKQKMIDDNEKQYGTEIREKYGDTVVNNSNNMIKGMSEELYNKSEKIRLEFEETLKAAFEGGDAASETAQKACDLHRQWLCFFYDGYCKEYHTSLAEMYVADVRQYIKTKNSINVFFMN